VIAVVVSGSGTSHAEFSIPGGSGEQLRTVPVGAADRVTVWFDRAVSVLQSSGTLTGHSVNPATTYASTGLTTAADGRSATWTFSQFPADMMEFSLEGDLSNSVTDQATGSRLDGDWSNPSYAYDAASGAISSFPSGDGTEGGDFTFRFTILPGDANRDNTVGLADVAIMQANYFGVGTESNVSGFGFRRGDFDGDGAVSNQLDYVQLFRPHFMWVWGNWGNDHRMGDYQLDLDVDFDDIEGLTEILTSSVTAYAQAHNLRVEMVLAVGDIDQNGVIDFDEIPLFVTILTDMGDTLMPDNLA